ncbi:hypothetical protein Lal_00000533 [Lupinus albus]|nr:hypothetical protein Lal_00000533 [Lupinus albus]
MAMNGRLRGLRLSRSRKLSLMAFSAILLPRRKLVRIYNDVVNQMSLENMCSAITSSQLSQICSSLNFVLDFITHIGIGIWTIFIDVVLSSK